MGTLFRQVSVAAGGGADRTAVLDLAQELTFGELVRRAGNLGRYLAARGVAPGHRVGVLVERGVDLVTALLGVSAAGAAYVPLDPAYPPERLRMIVEDAGLTALVTDSCASPPGAPAVQTTPVVPAGDDTVELPQAGPDDPAYVIYTSGSTGRPKGVVVTNANAAAFLDAVDALLGVPVDDRFLAVTSVSFDIALMELIWPLTRSASTVVAPSGMVRRLDPRTADSLLALIDRFRPSLMQATPSLLSAVAAYPAALASLRSLRALMVGGEVFPPGLAGRLLRALPDLRILNMYGPTEATVWCTAHDVTTADVRDGSIPIGRPMEHAMVRIVDEAGNEVEPGDSGELWAGGPCVAAGYFQRPELTRERFLRYAGPGGRWYRTGDRARLRADGVLEFVGRLDRQVKISGVRIELDEIEAVLSTLPDVRAAAVVAYEGPEGRPRLVAFVQRSAE